ncbi:MAG: hypothetical protein P9L89_01395 [Candidatus Celaenobacter polaris]|nr:hypothetical protein [Candidatus Celaenobacter polaris]
MNERLVQWTLLNNLKFLGKSLNFKIATKKGQEITTDFGRIDFILEDSNKNQLIVELETILNAKNKLQYCFYQIKNYKNVKFTENTEYCILYASETKESNKKLLIDFGIKNNVIIRSYSLKQVQTLYSKTVERLSLSFGLALPKPKNYTICYLRWLNKIMKPFYDYNKDSLIKDELANYFTSSNTTNFRSYLRLALDFEMIKIDNENFIITQKGQEYISNFNPIIFNAHPERYPSVDLINDQKRLLLTILTNGNWTVHKVNIYWFLRFIEVTMGEWIPNYKLFSQEKLDLVNGLFGVTYKIRTMYELLNFTCNFCIELGLVERIRSNEKYDKIYLTPLGIEVNNIFSLDLQTKKSRLNLNFKYLD